MSGNSASDIGGDGVGGWLRSSGERASRRSSQTTSAGEQEVDDDERGEPDREAALAPVTASDVRITL